ncbi:MAG: acyl-CoA dehydrogenase, partial [Thermoplasmata archaeon]
MEDILLDENEKKIKYEVREVVREIPHELIREIESEKVVFPRKFIQIITSKKIVGLRFPSEYGGRN